MLTLKNSFQENFTSGQALGLTNDSLRQQLASLTAEQALQEHISTPASRQAAIPSAQ